MNRANSLTARALRVPGLVVLALWLTAGSASAQTVTASNTSPAPLPVVDRTDAATPDKDLDRAEGLFQIGRQALGEGRESDARDAFDAALDVFIVLRAAGSTDPRLATAYANLIERIHDAEVAAGNQRQMLPALPFRTDDWPRPKPTRTTKGKGGPPPAQETTAPETK